MKNIIACNRELYCLDGVLKNTNGFRSSSLMRSITSSSSEDDTLFEKQKLLKNPPKKRLRSKSKPLIEIDAPNHSDSDEEFDGRGLDKSAVTLHGVKSVDDLV